MRRQQIPDPRKDPQWSRRGRPECQHFIAQLGLAEPFILSAIVRLGDPPQQILGAAVRGAAPLGDQPVDQRQKRCNIDPTFTGAGNGAQPARRRDEVEQAVAPGVLAKSVQYRIDIAIIGGEYPSGRRGDQMREGFADIEFLPGGELRQ